MKYIIFGITSIILVAVFVFAGFYYKGQQTEKINILARDNGSTFVRSYSQTLGSKDAKVHIVEFMDPACETCAAFSPFVKKIMEYYPGKIKLTLRYAPFHDGADYFVKILEASKKQGKYWKTVEVMFKSQSHWASHHDPQPQKIWQFLPMAGLNIEQLKKDMQDPAIEKILEQDMADTRTLNVKKTPGFFVNGKPLQEFGYRQLQTLIETELKEQYSGN